MHHSQIFDKIDSFRKPVLNIIILRNLILEWKRSLLRRELVSYIKSIDLGELLVAADSVIYQNKSWYYSGPFQISKVELFAKIVLCYKSLTFIVKSSNLDVWLVP